ncbi:hypothetical protein JCM6882_008035 [Rhodosporidiobolus microsporus]
MSGAPGKLSREEFRRQKDLEAARKAGTAAPALDEEGKPINPHIPQFMANAPWYMSDGHSGPTLKHHKAPKYNNDPGKLQERFTRGVKAGPAAKKFRAGACTNCGALTHTQKDCLERPRKVGAKFNHKNIAADEVIHDDGRYLNGLEGQGDYDVKRDRWDGYDPSSHKKVVEEYEALEEARRKRREEEIDKGTAEAGSKAVAKLAKKGKGKKSAQEAADEEEDEFGSSDAESDDHGGEDEDKYAEAADVAGQKLDTKTRVTVRNLRIREDTAKYLMNLDTESAYYDPKTRSMRDAPNPELAPEDAKFAGDNFTRSSGSTTDLQQLQLFAWQSSDRGHDVHIQSNPTAAALAHKEFLQKKEVLKDTSKASVLEKYGGEQYLQSVPRELRAGQTEHYVEYDRRGKVVKGMERAKARSKYEEDVYPGNHSSVWGSYFSTTSGKWGYACCHSCVKASYCAGQASIEAAAAEATGNTSLLSSSSNPFNKKAGDEADAATRDEGKSLVQLKREREDEERRKRKAGEGEEGGDGKRRKGEKGDEGAKDAMGVSEAEMEAYRRGREQRFDDPMAQMGTGDEVLPL